jgi:hypothetical protein
VTAAGAAAQAGAEKLGNSQLQTTINSTNEKEEKATVENFVIIGPPYTQCILQKD